MRGTSPIAIQPEATITQQAKAAGYDQIRFRWDDGVVRYEARWHTRTPGAPLEQGDTWVVERKIHGGPNRQQKALQILTGEEQWVSKATWTEAINARKAGIATPEQDALLAAGHLLG